jgi:hypothetical protein
MMERIMSYDGLCTVLVLRKGVIGRCNQPVTHRLTLEDLEYELCSDCGLKRQEYGKLTPIVK